MLTRRGLIRGLGTLLVAPAIVRASSLMPVSVYHPDLYEMEASGAVELLQVGDKFTVEGSLYIVTATARGPDLEFAAYAPREGGILVWR